MRLTVAGDTPTSRAILAGKAQPAQGSDPFGALRWRWPIETARARRAILQACQALGFEASQPFARGARADACGSCGGLRRLPAQQSPNKMFSTKRRQAGILVDVHPIPPRTLKLRKPQLPRNGSDGQPIESSHLAPQARCPPLPLSWPLPERTTHHRGGDGARCPRSQWLRSANPLRSSFRQTGTADI